MAANAPADVSDEASDGRQLPLGCPVTIKGLVSRHELNGTQAVVEEFQPSRECYLVQLPDRSMLLVRRKNLQHWNDDIALMSTDNDDQQKEEANPDDAIAAALTDLAAGTPARRRWVHDVTAKPLDGTLPAETPVTLTGLVKATSLNGKAGKIVASRTENRHIVQVEGRREPVTLKADNLLVRRVTRVVVFLASHIDTAERAAALQQCLRSIQGQTTYATLHISWSASTPELADGVAALLEELLTAAERANCFRHDAALSQFEHLRFLQTTADEQAKRALQGAALPTTWILFTDDDDVWHPR